jgi:chromate transporter
MTGVGRPRLSTIFTVFLVIGAFTIGGGYAMLPLIKHEVTQKKKWLDDAEFVDLLAVSQSGPGPIAINTAVLTGYRLAGLSGAIVATAGATLPSLLSILLIASVFTSVGHSPYVEAVFHGARPAVVALIASAAYAIGKHVITDVRSMSIGIVALAALLIGVHPFLVVSAGIATGVLLGE